MLAPSQIPGNHKFCASVFSCWPRTLVLCSGDYRLKQQSRFVRSRAERRSLRSINEIKRRFYFWIRFHKLIVVRSYTPEYLVLAVGRQDFINDMATVHLAPDNRPSRTPR
ncbi:hypothetical protein TcasGA2_TC011036 [Tribolium castaneum]|uniref:Uncharacterized protein n=1 Tax=Tribolium castaneum TaxID=7070 RepID=D6X4U7_TRICA|nr:hypothetical protein TcasGA2_TC011036 [Tribolium castaneum]